MKKVSNPQHFSTRLGVLLSMSGSAVGPRAGGTLNQWLCQRIPHQDSLDVTEGIFVSFLSIEQTT